MSTPSLSTITTAPSAAPAPSLVLAMAAGAGFSVASLYYSQPMLGLIAQDLGAGERAVGLVPTLTQLGYALGILLLGVILSFSRIALMAWPFSVMSRPLPNVIIMPNWSQSRTNFSYPIASPPSNHPAECNTKLVPAMIVGISVEALSYAAWASGSFDAHSEPPERNGTPRRRASAATVYNTMAGSGVPNVGAPVSIDMELANDPKITGAPGRTS